MPEYKIRMVRNSEVAAVEKITNQSYREEVEFPGERYLKKLDGKRNVSQKEREEGHNFFQ